MGTSSAAAGAGGGTRVGCVGLVLVSVSLLVHWLYCQEPVLTLLMLEFVSLSLDTRIHGDENVDILLVPRLLVNTSSGKSPGKGRQEPPPPAPGAVFNVRHTPGGCLLTGMNSAVLWPEPSLFTSCKSPSHSCTPCLPCF